ncbi:MAG: hypothetical protein KGJ43_02775 [Acidobacteriota bacterium]|nr:hypothetical protein [Acidobacteriota bacterium]
MRARAVAAAFALLACGVVSACSASHRPSAAALRTRGADLAQAAHALLALEGPVAREVAASRAAWPLIAYGLVHRRLRKSARQQEVGALSPAGRRAIALAAQRARELPHTLMANAETLTGPAAAMAGYYEYFSGLASNGWAQIDAAAGVLASGPAAARAFERANVNTFVIAVWDAHFDLSLIPKTMRAAYKNLGGSHGTSRGLDGGEAAQIERAYSPGAVRLAPHPWRALVGG